MVRFKTRWVAAEIKCADAAVSTAFSAREIHGAIEDAVLVNFGDFGLGKVSRRLRVEDEPSNGFFVVQGPAEHLDILLGSLYFLSRIGRESVAIRVRHVSGTIISSRKHLRAQLESEVRRLGESGGHWPDDVFE